MLSRIARADIQDVFDSALRSRTLLARRAVSLLAVRLKQLVPHDAFALYLIEDDKLIPAICYGRQLPAVLVAYVFPWGRDCRVGWPRIASRF